MLSLDNCRTLLDRDGEELNDADLATLREQLYSLATLTVEVFSRSESQQDASFKDALALFGKSERETIEERAAVMEFEGKLEREIAERSAISQAVEEWNN
jgi:hypothetical protein